MQDGRIRGYRGDVNVPRRAFQPRGTLERNPILDVDSYKAAHSYVYPRDVRSMFAYVELRLPNREVVLFGLQMWLQKTFEKPITRENIDEAENFFALHGEPFDRDKFDLIIDQYDGWLPVIIRAIPEGLPVPSGNVIATIE